MRRLLFAFLLLLLRGVSAYGQTTTTTLYVPPSYPQNLQVHTITCGATPTVRLTWDASTPGTYPIAGYLVYLWNGHSFVPDNCNTGGCPGGATHSYSCCTGSPNAGILYINGTFPCNGSACSFTETLDFPGWPYYAVVAFDGHGLTPNPFSQTPSVCTAPDINGGSPGVCGPHLFDGCTPYPCFQCTYNGTDAATSQSSWCNPSASQKCDDCNTCVVTTTTVATTTTTLAPSACDTPTVIASGGGTFSGTTSGTDPLRPSCGSTGNSGAKVFQWTPAVSGTATLQTCGGTTNFDTVLSLRAGVCRTGAEVANGCFDDSCACGSGCAANVASKITPTVTAGQTYYAIVDGAAGRTGNFTLTVTPPVAVTTTSTTTTTTLVGASGTAIWASRYGGSSADVGQSVSISPSGRIVVGGYFVGSVDFGLGALVGAGSYDGIVADYASDGSCVAPACWTRRIGSTGIDKVVAVATTSDNGVVVAGVFQGTVDFGGTSKTAATNQDAFVARYGSTGTLTWVRNFGGAPGLGCTANMIPYACCTGAGTGTCANTIAISAVGVDSADDVIATGYLTGTANFDATVLASPGPNSYVVKLGATNGVVTWAKSYPNSGDNYTSALAVDGSRDIFIGGNFINTLDISGGSGAMVFTSPTPDAFVAKVSGVNGASIWNKRVGDSSANAQTNGLAVDGAGNVLATGTFSSTVNWGGGCSTLTSNQPDNFTGPDAFVAKLSGSNGTCAWSRNFTPSNNSDFGLGIAVDGSGNALVSGSFTGTTNFGTSNLSSFGDQDAFVAKLAASNGSTLWVWRGGGTQADRALAVSARGGTVAATGFFYGTANFGTGSKNSAGGSDVFLVSLVP